ncbi:MAG: hypothetical protein WCI53_04745 [Bacteroidota bacterium]|jgi:hypothetical protein
MNLQLIQGEFNSTDAIELIAQMVHIKIKYHENKINSNSNEEDIKIKESKIKHLQKELFELRKTINSKNNTVKVEAIIKIE